MERNRIRLNRFMAMCGLGSRRKCDTLIAEGGVTVNGTEVHEMGVQVDPAVDEVKYKGKTLQAKEEDIYILLNKPPQTVTTVSDEKNRRTVLDVVNLNERIFPVGRLDYNTTGVLMLTNDGDLSYVLAHPKFHFVKKYRVLLNDRIRAIHLHHFRNGIELDGTKTAPAKAEEIRILNNCSFLEVEIHEGRNRQIRRMFEELGYKVKKLTRIEFAGLGLGNLKEGQWRQLLPAEIQKIKKMVETRRDIIMQAEGSEDE